MHSLAQILLESMTTRERAVSTLGDLRETAATRGEWWFWWSVLRVAAALSWRGLAANPRAAFRPAARAWLMNLGLEGIAWMLGTLLYGYLVGRLSHLGTAYLQAIMLVLVAASQYLIGRWIGHRAPGAAMSVCLAFTLLQVAIEYPLLFAMMPASQAALSASLNLLTHVFCVWGALVSRPRISHA